MAVTENPNGSTANPVNYPVELLGPTNGDGTELTEAGSPSRALVTTPWNFTLNVPRFQPANQFQGSDHNSTAPDVPAGYQGMYYVYVDSSGNGILDRPNSFTESDSQFPSST